MDECEKISVIVKPIPRLPALDWNTFSGANESATRCVLTNPENHFTNSGRASILLALEMLGVGPGEKILVPTYHCPTMIAPIVALGATPIFYPLDELGAPRLDWIKGEFVEGTRALLVAHFFGLPQPMKEMRQWCTQQGVRLIEDCAHALFGSVDGRDIGAWGDVSIASLTKFLPVPEGGCLVTNMLTGPIPALHEPGAVGQLKAALDIFHVGVTHSRLTGLGTVLGGLYSIQGRLKGKRKHAVHHPNGTASSLSEGFTIDTVLAHRSLTHASRWMARNAPRGRIVSRRRENYDFFVRSLSGLPGMRPLFPDLPVDCAPYVFPLWVDRPDPGYSELRGLEFPVSRWDRLWPTVPSMESDSGVKWSSHVLQLACHQDLTLAERQQMVITLKQVYGTRGS